MGIFDIIRSSVFDPAFYAGLRNRSWSEGAKYYAVVAFLIVFAYVVPLWGFLLAAKPEMVDTIVAVYPDTLEITVADGVMSINQPEPFAIPNTFTDDLPDNLAVFDTRNDDFSPTMLRDADSLIVLKKTFAVMQDTGNLGRQSIGEQRVFQYGTSTGTSTLSKGDITAVAEKVKPYVRPVAIIGGAFLFVLAVLIGGIGMLVFHMLYLFFPALLVYAYFKMRKQNETYRTAYVTALFASIPVAILSALFGLFGGLPLFTYTLILMIIVIVNLTQAQKQDGERAV